MTNHGEWLECDSCGDLSNDSNPPEWIKVKRYVYGNLTEVDMCLDCQLMLGYPRVEEKNIDSD